MLEGNFQIDLSVKMGGRYCWGFIVAKVLEGFLVKGRGSVARGDPWFLTRMKVCL